jgi:hypothetical protein
MRDTRQTNKKKSNKKKKNNLSSRGSSGTLRKP